MAWSYRTDRADEVYATTSGPAAATTEQLPRPPMDGEDTDNVLNPPEVEEEGAKRVDPEAAPPPPPSTEGMSAEEIQKEKLGPAPPPSPEEQQKAIDEARGSAPKEEKPKTETKSPAASKK